jgi:hypothetical protein
VKLERKRRIREGGQGYEGECENEEDEMKMERKRRIRKGGQDCEREREKEEACIWLRSCNEKVGIWIRRRELGSGGIGRFFLLHWVRGCLTIENYFKNLLSLFLVGHVKFKSCLDHKFHEYIQECDAM